MRGHKLSYDEMQVVASFPDKQCGEVEKHVIAHFPRADKIKRIYLSRLEDEFQDLTEANAATSAFLVATAAERAPKPLKYGENTEQAVKYLKALMLPYTYCSMPKTFFE